MRPRLLIIRWPQPCGAEWWEGSVIWFVFVSCPAGPWRSADWGKISGLLSPGSVANQIRAWNLHRRDQLRCWLRATPECSPDPMRFLRGGGFPSRIWNTTRPAGGATAKGAKRSSARPEPICMPGCSSASRIGVRSRSLGGFGAKAWKALLRQEPRPPENRSKQVKFCETQVFPWHSGCGAYDHGVKQKPPILADRRPFGARQRWLDRSFSTVF